MAKCLTPQRRAAVSVTSFSALCLECAGEGLEQETSPRHRDQCSGQTSHSAFSGWQNCHLPGGICFVLPCFCFVWGFFGEFLLLLSCFWVLFNKAPGSAGPIQPPSWIRSKAWSSSNLHQQGLDKYVCSGSAPSPNGLVLVSCFSSVRKRCFLFPYALSFDWSKLVQSCSCWSLGGSAPASCASASLSSHHTTPVTHPTAA